MKVQYLLIYALIIALTSAACSSMKLPDNPKEGLLAEAIFYLADDKLKGRATGTMGEKIAGDYIAKKYQELSLVPQGDEPTFFQSYEAVEMMHAHGDDMPSDAPKVTGRNVVALLDHGASNTIVIGAHYDHLGTGEFGSLYQGPAAIHNGADDNASGVAVMLYLAEQLSDKKYSHNNYLFIAFSGEEKGLWGSNYWTKHPTYPLEKINYMMNLDMVGRLENNKLAINGTGTSSAWKALDKTKKKFNLVKSESGIGPSDHTSFYLQDIPSIHFFTGQHEDYHKPTDDVEKVNFSGCYEIAFYILRIIDEIGGQKIDFVKTKDADVETPAFKVTLGVIPDYMHQEKGMRIDGVRGGKTADVAGILDGDVVIKMGDLVIDDMNSYMQALSKFEPGQTIEIVVLRKGQEVTKTITFQ